MKSSPPPSRRSPERIGHRGAPREFRENTLPSFARALELGADAVELDVHCSSDGVVVVHHDPTIISNAAGGRSPVEIARTPWEALRTIEVGAGVTMPTLDDVLDTVGKAATVYVEIKGKDIEGQVVNTVRRHQTSVAIHSFDHRAVAAVNVLDPSIPTGVLVDTDSLDDPFAALSAVRARDLWPHYSLIDDSLVKRVHDAGGRVIAWTVNTPEEVARLVRLNVDGICTDALGLLHLA